MSSSAKLILTLNRNTTKNQEKMKIIKRKKLLTQYAAESKLLQKIKKKFSSSISFCHNLLLLLLLCYLFIQKKKKCIPKITIERMKAWKNSSNRHKRFTTITTEKKLEGKKRIIINSLLFICLSFFLTKLIIPIHLDEYNSLHISLLVKNA